MSELKIIEASHHRNGVSGEPFWAILFDDKEHGRMIASLFEPSTYCAVFNIEELSKGNIKMAEGNSWRGDEYVCELKPLLEEWKKEHK